MKNQLVIRDIPLAGILMGSITILNIFFSFFPILMGYSINFFIIPFAFSLIILKSKLIKTIFFILTPFILIMAPNIYFINIGQVFVEYFLAIWCFFPFLFGNLIMNNLNKYERNNFFKLLVFSLIFILCWILKLFLHIIAGYFWWTNRNWMGSFLVNWPIIIFNILFTIPIFTIIFERTIRISKSYYLNIWNDSKL